MNQTPSHTSTVAFPFNRCLSVRLDPTSSHARNTPITFIESINPDSTTTPLPKMSDAETPPPHTRRRSTVPTPGSPQSSSSSEEGELNPTAERAHLDAQISLDLQNATRDVMQKDVRYFTGGNVVCSNCGTKGHLSFDCTEKEDESRCNLCGATGHGIKDCPTNTCYTCKKSGHRARDCPEKGQKRQFHLRKVGPPRKLTMDCYVCGKTGHLDCSLEKMSSGVLSCYNCGMKGHAGSGCTVPPAEKVIPIVMEMERERRLNKKKGKGETKEQKAEAAMKFREMFLEKAKQKRYKRDYPG